MENNTTHNTTEQGQGMVEYSLILTLVSVVVIIILIVLGPLVGNVFSTVVDSFGDAPVVLAEEPEPVFCEQINGAEYTTAMVTVIRVGDPVYTDSNCSGSTRPRDRLMVKAANSGTANSLCTANGGAGVGFGSGSNDWWFCN